MKLKVETILRGRPPQLITQERRLAYSNSPPDQWGHLHGVIRAFHGSTKEVKSITRRGSRYRWQEVNHRVWSLSNFTWGHQTNSFWHIQAVGWETQANICNRKCKNTCYTELVWHGWKDSSCEERRENPSLPIHTSDWGLPCNMLFVYNA